MFSPILQRQPGTGGMVTGIPLGVGLSLCASGAFAVGVTLLILGVYLGYRTFPR